MPRPSRQHMRDDSLGRRGGSETGCLPDGLEFREIRFVKRLYEQAMRIVYKHVDRALVLFDVVDSGFHSPARWSRRM